MQIFEQNFKIQFYFRLNKQINLVEFGSTNFVKQANILLFMFLMFKKKLTPIECKNKKCGVKRKCSKWFYTIYSATEWLFKTRAKNLDSGKKEGSVT